MRNQEIFEKLKAAQATKDFSYFNSSNIVDNTVDFRNRVDAVAEIPGFDNDVKFFHESVLYRSVMARFELPPNEWAQFRTFTQGFSQRLVGLYRYLETVLREQSKDSVFIKLPQCSDFNEAISYQKQFETAISQLVLDPIIHGKVELRSWENGSLWLEIFLDGTAAVSVVGSAAWAAVVVSNKLQEVRMHSEFVRSLKIKNESLEEIKNAQSEMLRMLVEQEAKSIADGEYSGLASPEQFERIKFTIKEFSELIDKGAEIHPALQAPESVANLFPNMKNLLAVTSRIKMLGDVKSEPNT